MTMYTVKELPVMLQNAVLMSDTPVCRPLMFVYIHADDRYFWFTVHSFNGLIRMDRQSWKAEYICHIPNNAWDMPSQFVSLIQLDGGLLLSPHLGKDFFVYGESDKTPCNFSVAKIFDNESPVRKFTVTVRYNDYLVCVAGYDNVIFRVHIHTGAIERFSECGGELERLRKHSGELIFSSHCVFKNFLILPSVNAPAVVVFDMETGESKVFQVGEKNSGYSDVCYDGEHFWLAPRYTDCVVRWHMQSGDYKEFGNLYGGCEDIDISYISVAFCGGYVWAFPYHAPKAIKIDVSIGEVSIAEAFQPECEKGNDDAFYPNVNYCFQTKVIDNVIYTHTGKSNTLIAYNPATGERREEHIVLGEKHLDKIKSLKFETLARKADCNESVYDCFFYESSFIGLNDFIDYISSCSEKNGFQNKQKTLWREAAERMDGTSGQAIFDFVRSHCK